MNATIARLLLALGLFFVPAAASAQMPGRDRVVFEQIADQVNRYTQYTIFDSISASVDNGRVVLTGWVTMPYKRDDLERRIARLDGVVSLENGIDVLPVSTFDDELRFRIARAIYGNSSFWQYASMVSCPDTVRNASRPKKSWLKATLPSGVRGSLAKSSVDIRNSALAPSASDDVMIGVLTQ